MIKAQYIHQFIQSAFFLEQWQQDLFDFGNNSFTSWEEG